MIKEKNKSQKVILVFLSPAILEMEERGEGNPNWSGEVAEEVDKESDYSAAAAAKQLTGQLSWKKNRLTGLQLDRTKGERCVTNKLK